MKITKRLSLSSMITERYNGPLPHDFLMKRIYFAKYQDQPLAVSEELVKNGYTMKPKLTPLGFWVMVGGMALGSCFYFYLQNLRRVASS